jgi:beta-propeller repeat-containing protein/PKD domain-containing protein
MTTDRPYRLTALWTLFLVTGLAIAGTLAAADPGDGLGSDRPSRPPTAQAFGDFPLYFIENRGQAGPDAAYYLQGRDKSVYFTSTGLVFSLSGKAKGQRGKAKEEPAVGSKDRLSAQRSLLHLDFVGAATDVWPLGEEQTPAKVSYLKGPRDQWLTGLETYASVAYRNLWPGIDLVYCGTQDRLKYTFLVRPGADPSRIRLRYRGATSVSVNDAGELEVETPAGGFHDERPTAYQEVNGKQAEVAVDYDLNPVLTQVEVATTYALNTSTPQHPNTPTPTVHEYSFRIGEYDQSRPLVIDPAVLVYAGFIGSDSTEVGADIAVDSAGNAYVVGSATPPFNSTSAKAQPAALPPVGDTDAFVAKVNAAGTALIYTAFVGGLSEDLGNDIALFEATPGSAFAYITGGTASDEMSFPVLSGPDLTFNSPAVNNLPHDAYVAKISEDGTGLLFAGYIGGAGETGTTDDDIEEGSGIAVDGMGNAYVCGVTDSTQASFPDGDPDMNDMMPVPGFDQTFNGAMGRTSTDAFVVKVTSAGAFAYAGYIGGADENVTTGVGTEGALGIAVDTPGNTYVCGFTSSTEASFPDGDPDVNDMMPAPGPDQTFNGGVLDGFVARVNAAGTMLDLAGYIGGAEIDFAFKVALFETMGGTFAYLTGLTASPEASFPNGNGFASLPGLPGPDQTFNGGVTDAFVAKLNAPGTGFLYAGYIGGAGEAIVDPMNTTLEGATAIAVDRGGNAYVAGLVNSTEASFPNGNGLASLPGVGTPDPTFNAGLQDAFVARVNFAGTGLDFATYLGGRGDDLATGIALDTVGSAYVSGTTNSNEVSFPTGGGFAALPGLPGPDQTFGGGSSDAFAAKIAFNAPPTVVCPPPVVVTAPSQAGAQVTLTAEVADPDSSLLRVTWTVDGIIRQMQDIAHTPGGPPTLVPFTFTYSISPIPHDVGVTVSDFINAPVTCPTSVTVNPPPNQPPAFLQCPVTQTVTATSPAGAQVTLNTQVTDPDGDPLTVVWNVDGGAPEQTTNVPASGPPTQATVPFTFTYALGAHTVDITLSDGINPTVTCPQIILTVVNQPPAVVCPENVTVPAASSSGAVVTLSAQVSDPDGHALTVTWNVDGGAVEETDSVPAGGPPTSAAVSFTHTYSVGTHQVVITVSDGIAAPVVCPPVIVTVIQPVSGPGHAGGSGGIKTANGLGCFNFGVVGRLRGRASGALSFKEQAINGSTAALFDGRSIRIDSAVFGGTTGNLTLLVRGQMKTNRYGTVPFQVDALDRGTPGVPRDEFRLTVLADTNGDGIPEPVLFSGKLVTVPGKMNNISLRPGLPPH